MILVVKTLFWSLPIWCLLVWVNHSPVLSDSLLDQIRGLLMVLNIPGHALDLLWSRNIHNYDIRMVLVANSLFYSILLYLFLLSKARFNFHRKK